MATDGHVYPEVDDFNMETEFLQRKQLYRNLGDGQFQEVTGDVGGGLLLERSSRGTAFGDYDNDGDLDIVVVNLNDRPTLLLNEGGNGNHWFKLRLVGTASNRDAIGARITMKIGSHVQTAEVRSGGSYLSHNDSRVHFGLGDTGMIDYLRIHWPSGVVETFENLLADQIVIVKEDQGIVARSEADQDGH